MNPLYKRVLLKISGEALFDSPSDDSSKSMMEFMLGEVSQIHALGIEISIVIGGGNIMRGIKKDDENIHDRVIADQIGMLATVMNALRFADAIESNKIKATVMTSFRIDSIAERFNKSDALNYLADGRIVLFAGGTSNPYFSTDSAAALRALEINADLIIKGSNVDGVYDKDPHKFKDAVKLDELTYNEALEKDLRVLDQTAFALLKDHNIPIIVYQMSDPDSLVKIVNGEKVGSLVKPD